MSFFPPGSLLAAIFLILSIFSGIWLTRIGRPLNVVIMTIHKLIALAAVVLTVVALYRAYGATGINPVDWITILVTGILFLALFASGAILSGGKVVRGALVVTHKIFPYLTAICFFLIFFHSVSGR
jgi:hypothetical protein